MKRLLIICLAALVLICGCADSPAPTMAPDYRGDQAAQQADLESTNANESTNVGLPPSQARPNGRTLILLATDCSKSTVSMRPQLLSAAHDLAESIDEATTDLESYRFGSTVQQWRSGVGAIDDYDAELAKVAMRSDANLGTNYPKLLDQFARRAMDTRDETVEIIIEGDALSDYQDATSLKLYRSAAESFKKNSKVKCVRYYGAVPGTWESLRKFFSDSDKLQIRTLDQPIGD